MRQRIFIHKIYKLLCDEMRAWKTKQNTCMHGYCLAWSSLNSKRFGIVIAVKVVHIERNLVWLVNTQNRYYHVHVMWCYFDNDSRCSIPYSSKTIVWIYLAAHTYIETSPLYYCILLASKGTLSPITCSQCLLVTMFNWQ
jgi:hypothetical protein